jgi:hypothetical protein
MSRENVTSIIPASQITEIAQHFCATQTGRQRARESLRFARNTQENNGKELAEREGFGLSVTLQIQKHTGIRLPWAPKFTMVAVPHCTGCTGDLHRLRTMIRRAACLCTRMEGAHDRVRFG